MKSTLVNRSINVTLTDASGKQFTFEKLNQLIDFCRKEQEFWVKVVKPLGENITINPENTKLNQFTAILGVFDTWKETESNWDEDTFNQNLHQLKRQHINQISGNWIWHGHAFVPVWVDLHAKSQATADAFLNTVLRKPTNTISSSVDHLIGHILGYEFLMQDESELTKRRNSERKSISQLRNQLQEKNNELIAEVDSFESEIDSWDKEKKKENERAYQIRKRLGERQIRQQKTRFRKRLNEWQERVSNLEDTYEEKLRLRKPAEYWNRASKKYGVQGMVFSLVIALLVLVGLSYFETFFVAWLQGQQIGVKLNTLQGVVIFGTIVAIYAFLVRVFSRLAFSSFHLMRDAEERDQLTYLYLSLSEETSVDEESRKIVLQALFSRTETGLLAQEHGPAIPGFSDAIRGMGKRS